MHSFAEKPPEVAWIVVKPQKSEPLRSVGERDPEKASLPVSYLPQGNNAAAHRVFPSGKQFAHLGYVSSVIVFSRAVEKKIVDRADRPFLKQGGGPAPDAGDICYLLEETFGLFFRTRARGARTLGRFRFRQPDRSAPYAADNVEGEGYSSDLVAARKVTETGKRVPKRCYLVFYLFREIFREKFC